jgi:hypothetical protein
MRPKDETEAAGLEQIQVLEELISRARERGVHTGIRNDELEDLSQSEAAELIEQLRRRLGEARG